ncbi:hypothetical protein C5Y96_24255 [Blastopirellula marina]|uniref:Uncharacterized protein n=1 Tax=Blastopirellula marina TaxID=124 RepID=A0A2S8EZW2_9BACT|nr:MULTISPECIES: hypothetical protein [Pirellulaceae]PQO25458.1 hypothetical protein C5Y96_24255 [Blastopirellula marina]RCS42422.1 hypothetical protein DTL36_24305 [Bremerella cremea]
MSNDQFTVEEPKKSGSGCTTAIIGCLVVCLVLAGVACGVGYYVYINIGVMAANLAESQLNAVIDEFDLPEDQKSGMKEQVSRVAQGYRDGDISMEQLGSVAEHILESPAFTAVPVEIARSKYIEPSGLTDEEKAEAKKQLQRVAHGAFEKKISEDELKALLDGRIADEQPDGNLQFRDDVPDEDLRDLTAAAKALADEKEVADQNFEIDLAAELKKAVDKALLGTDDEELDIEIPEAPVEIPAEPQTQEAGN